MVGFPAPGTSSDSSFLCSYVLCLHLCPYPPPRKGPVGGCALLLSVLPEGTQRVSTFPLVTPCHPPTTRALGLSVSLSHQGSRSGNSSGSLSILGPLLCHVFAPSGLTPFLQWQQLPYLCALWPGCLRLPFSSLRFFNFVCFLFWDLEVIGHLICSNVGYLYGFP